MLDSDWLCDMAILYYTLNCPHFDILIESNAEFFIHFLEYYLILF